MAEAADPEHEDHKDPDRVRIERLERPHVAVWQQGKNHQSRRRENQCVGDFALAQNALGEAVHRRLRGEQDCDDDADGAGEGGVLERESAKERHEGERDLGGEARVFRRRAQIGHDDQRGDGGGGERQHERPANVKGDGAEQGGDGEGPHPGRTPRGPLALAAFALDADQQAKTERDEEAGEGLREREHQASPIIERGQVSLFIALRDGNGESLSAEFWRRRGAGHASRDGRFAVRQGGGTLQRSGQLA